MARTVPESVAFPGWLRLQRLVCRCWSSLYGQPCGPALLSGPVNGARFYVPYASSWLFSGLARAAYLPLSSRHHRSTHRHMCRHIISLKPCVLTYFRPSSAMGQNLRRRDGPHFTSPDLARNAELLVKLNCINPVWTGHLRKITEFQRENGKSSRTGTVYTATIARRRSFPQLFRAHCAVRQFGACAPIAPSLYRRPRVEFKRDSVVPPGPQEVENS